MKTRKGIEILSDCEGAGDALERGAYYRMTTKIWLHRGEPVVWSKPHGLLDRMELSDDGTALTADYRLDRECLISGIFYGILDMKVGGTRRLKIAPHLAYRDRGVGGMIPPNALLTVEVSVLSKRY